MAENWNSSTHETISTALREAAGIIHRVMVAMGAVDKLRREPEDIVSEFYLFLLEHDARPLYLYEGRNGAQFGSYVGKIFHNWLFRRINRPATDEISLSDVLSTKISDKRKTAERETEDEQIYRALRDCISRLDDMEKQIINQYLDYQTKLSVICRRIGISQSQIYGIWEKLTRRLKSCLEGKGFSRALAV